MHRFHDSHDHDRQLIGKISAGIGVVLVITAAWMLAALIPMVL